jgi:hypothetical protein
MITRLRPDYLEDFSIVARLICGGDAPWLAKQLWRWNQWLYRDLFTEKMRPTRAQMRSKLRDIENALLLITEALEPSGLREFLDAAPSGPIADPERLRLELEDLGFRARQAQDCPDLATSSGATRSGPGKARPEGMSPRTLCAVVISEAWKHVRGAYPSPKNRRAAEAAEIYWRAAGGEAHNCGDEPRAVWRYHLEKAASSTAKAFRAEFKHYLVESERDWNREHSVAETA